MDNLRIILIVLGIIIVVAIYLWERYQSKNDLEKFRVSVQEDDDEPRLVITTKTKFDDDVSSELANLKNFMSDSYPPDSESDTDAILANDLFDGEDGEAEFNDSENDSVEEDGDTAEPVIIPRSAEADAPQQNENIVILHVVAAEDSPIEGGELLAIIEQLGFKFGDMDIFHYYDDDDSAARKSLFSLVNMHEPGSFNLQNIKDIKIQGVSIFACLPNDSSSDNIFNSMLAVTKHLAEILDCEIWGPDRRPLTPEKVQQIQNQLLS